MPRIGACAKVGARSRKLKLRWCHCLTPGYIQTLRWLYAVERLALRAVAPRRAARRLRPPGADYDSGRPLCAGGVVAARPLPPLGAAWLVPVGGSPTATGGPPVLPI